jgi:hypothetical protein
MVASPDGALHVVFNTNTSPSTVEYARCASDCGVRGNWTLVTIGGGQFTGSTRLVAGTDNRLHVLYEVSATGGSSELNYATCASTCTQASSWTKTNLAALFGGGWSSPFRGIPLVIDAQNRLSFTVDRSTYTDGGLTLATCAADCGTLSNWSAGRIRSGGTRTSLAARGTTLHQLVDNATASTGGTRLAYRTCSANCTQEASWQELPDLFVYDGEMPTAIAVTAQGGVRVVYNQGVSAASEPPAIKAQDSKMLTWSCDTNCLQTASWSGFITGAAGDGAKGLSLVEHGGSLVVAVTSSDKVFTRLCGQNCLEPANWQEAEVDSAARVTAEYSPFTYVGATCSGTAAQSATWHMENAVAAVRPDGSAAFVHAVSILRICPGSTGPVYIPGYGRLLFVP